MVKQYPEEKMFPIMQRNALRLKTLINQLLDLSKLEAGQLVLDVQQGDLAQFFKEFSGFF
ncbi:MAG: hypothetical protein IPO07_26830 [Haliscomenobacter sp.]|nr:hypothetical protein [Haliscomenobacter sp.]MBK9492013.1 hypothetical protein [Haliscomenobacter sp.]